jgi:hypothetical protein
MAAGQVLRILGEDRVEAVEVHKVTRGLVGDPVAAVGPVLGLTAAKGVKEAEKGPPLWIRSAYELLVSISISPS